MNVSCCELPLAAADVVITAPALRYHGAKFRLASWIMQFFPGHDTYTEAFGGAAGVLLQKTRSRSEVYNDLDGDIANFFRVLRDPTTRATLIESLVLTPYARDEFNAAWDPCADPLERARRTAIRAQMGFGSAGATKGATGFRTDTKRRPGNVQQLWAEYPENIARVGQRMTGVLIENSDAIEVMQAHDGKDTLHFVDPPYVHSTRAMRANGYYRHEMSDMDHGELLACLCDLKGMVVLSGYDSPLYSMSLRGWGRHETSSNASGYRGGVRRTEIVWLNRACRQRLEQQEGLFAVRNN
jgi:DNA adenine methylase